MNPEEMPKMGTTNKKVSPDDIKAAIEDAKSNLTSALGKVALAVAVFAGETIAIKYLVGYVMPQYELGYMQAAALLLLSRIALRG